MNSNWVHRGFEIRYKSVRSYYFRYELILDLHSPKGIMFTFEYHLDRTSGQMSYLYSLFSFPAI